MLSLELVNSIFEYIKNCLRNSLKNKDIDRSLSSIDCFANVAQFVNSFLRDDYIEECLSDISQIYVNPIVIEGKKKRVVFYDQVGTTICLGLQYIRGLYENGYKIQYIFEHPVRGITPLLLGELQKMNVDILLLERHGNKKSLETIQSIMNCIENFSPEKIIIHAPCDGALACILLYAIKNIDRYRIVPGDHHFYIGYNCIDYFFEFRDWGIELALEHRKRNKEETLKLPFYPIVDIVDHFKGFPDVNSGCNIRFLLAGAAYKFNGSDFIFELSDWILSNYSNALIYYVGHDFERIHSFVSEKKCHDRFILLGYRDDFTSCVKNIDVLINSYPIGGGIVCQTAAFFRKPIVSYRPIPSESNSIREILGVSCDFGQPITMYTKSDIEIYIDKLITDDSFRVSEGIRLNSYLQTKDNFDKELGKLLTSNIDNKSVNKVNDKSLNTAYYLNLHSVYKPLIIVPLVRFYGISILFRFYRLIMPLNKSVLCYVSRAFLSIYFMDNVRKIRSKCGWLC